MCSWWHKNDGKYAWNGNFKIRLVCRRLSQVLSILYWKLSYLHYLLSKPNRIQLKGRHRIVCVVRLVDFVIYDSIDMIPSFFFSLLDFIECFYTYVNRGVKWGEVKYVKTHRSTGASNDSATPSFSIGLHHNFPILHLNYIDIEKSDVMTEN